uniref:major histocompatibility complex class I-related gene protein isoform X2 n=1 Tax=Maylandia zebra TaxID=106582 RepID=UPI00064594D1|nr:major histocompatibility complex class I-related gene protein isoform X2 [Maylandia zebra]
MKLFLLLFFCHLASPVKHNLKYLFTASSGVHTLPTLVAVATVDEVEIMYCDSNTKVVNPKQIWMEKLFEDEPNHLEWYNQACASYGQIFREQIVNVMLDLNQHEGDHILQRLSGCEWDNDTGEVNGFRWYGYDGEDFLKFDMKTDTWIPAKPQAELTKRKWDNNTDYNRYWKNFHTNICPQWLKKYVSYGRNSLLRTELPSVSLLQKTPASLVSCHATGFHPNRAEMFWRKDGEEIHDGVKKGEILPNNDGTFQMSVNMKLSSNASEDWKRYDCVFQLSGVDDIITKLNKGMIRTNLVSPTEFVQVTAPAVVIVVGLLLLGLCIAGFFIWRRSNNEFQHARTSDL